MRRFIFIFVALWLAVSQLEAASPAETHRFTEAETSFRIGLWERAEKDLGAFAEKYPKSTNLTEAFLLQAEARMKLGRLGDAAAVLSAHLNQAGERTDEYLYWLAQIKFQDAKFSEAADVFGRLARAFPKSAHWLEAALGEAAASAKLEEHWPRVVELLADPNGAFQSAAKLDPANEFVYRGGLLLAEAQFALTNYPAAEATLTTLTDKPAGTELNWQRQFLLSRVQLADGRMEEALQSVKELLALAGTSKMKPESVSLEAKIFEQLNRTNDAIVAYQENLGGEVPVERQQQALFKVAELSMSLGKWDDAAKKMELFLSQNTNSPVADVVLFTLGDLYLKKYLASLDANRPPDTATNLSGITNILRTATTRFQMLTDKFPNSGLMGKALLNKGWSLWFSGDIAGSLNAFQGATRRLPPSEEQLVARFKWADAQSRLKDSAGAITNYNYVVSHARMSSESQTSELVEPALYQLLRASLNARDLKSANDALTKILDWYPNGFAAAPGLLLTGQGFARGEDAARARALFADFEKLYPTHPLLPEVRLAVARTYEQEWDWTNAIQQYDEWLTTFTNSPARPRAEYYQAWANFQAGDETNALALFTSFVSRFSTDGFAPSARWWIADHYFQLGNQNYGEAEKNYREAEKNYQLVFQNYPSSELAYPAKMMAGRAAVARPGGYSDAIKYYFTNLANDVSCPVDLRAQATFAYADALISRDSTNKPADLMDAISVLKTIPSSYGTNLEAVLTWGRIGDCYLQLAVTDARQYDNATNYYQQVIDSTRADFAAWSQAEVGMGMVFEKMAELNKEPEKSRLLFRARDYYWNVVLRAETNRKSGEEFNANWASRAGLAAGRLEETFQHSLQVTNLYKLPVMNLTPAMRAEMEKRIKKLQEQPAK